MSRISDQRVRAAVQPWVGPHTGIQMLGEALAMQVVQVMRSGAHACDYWARTYPKLKSNLLMKTTLIGDNIDAHRAWSAVLADTSEPPAFTVKLEPPALPTRRIPPVPSADPKVTAAGVRISASVAAPGTPSGFQFKPLL